MRFLYSLFWWQITSRFGVRGLRLHGNFWNLEIQDAGRSGNLSWSHMNHFALSGLSSLKQIVIKGIYGNYLIQQKTDLVVNRKVSVCERQNYHATAIK